ncbi:putative FAD dependent oxidoreductase, FAD/NAD(P)-binding domain superfamily, MTOX family [Septoria linicola]|nr:putative FAD dependent oxidoreductase, FAD/NAD(P)-binding domain superfamily, MTOX family [Septoria linicola]
MTGGLVFFPRDVVNASLDDFIKSLETEQIPYELLSAQAVADRWPQFQLPANVDAVYTHDSGILHAAKSVAAMQSLARLNGAVLKENTLVDRIVSNKSEDGYLLETSKGQVLANKVILATDAWSNKLLEPLGTHIPLSVTQEQVTYFQLNPETIGDYTPQRLPVWIWFGEKSFYGFPTYGEPTIKFVQDSSGNYMTPENRTFTPSPTILQDLVEFTEALIPAKGVVNRTITCQYTITPNRQLIMSPLARHPSIILGLGAAIGFKYAPAIGRVLAELAIDGESSEDIANFSIPRSIRESRL